MTLRGRLWASPLGGAGLRLRNALRRSRAFPRDARRWVAIARAPAPSAHAVRVSYGRERLPGPDEPAHGGMIKLQSLERQFPNVARGFTILYLVSSALPPDERALLLLARRRDARVVVNQNGVAYAGWYGPGWQRVNRRLARVLHAADHVLFQSEFCRLSADTFLGERRGTWEVLHNPVDTERFSPGRNRPRTEPTALLAGNQYQWYRFETALRAFAEAGKHAPFSRLFVAGRLSWSQATDPNEAPRAARALIAELGLEHRVELLGAYTQREAPALMRRADLLLHPKYNDPCPGVVLEAMASGLPIVYSASGGVPELVGDEAGVGVPAPLDWTRDFPPKPEELAEAMVRVRMRLGDYGEAARRRAVERFDVRPWLARHRELFASVLTR